MTDFIIQKFIKNYQDTGNPAVRENYGKLAGAVGIVSNLFLFAIKIYFISNPEPESTDLPAEHNWKIQDLIPSS